MEITIGSNLCRRDSFLGKKYFGHTKRGVACGGATPMQPGRMRSSLKVGSNDSTNAPEPASTLCNTSPRELAGEMHFENCNRSNSRKAS